MIKIVSNNESELASTLDKLRRSNPIKVIFVSSAYRTSKQALTNVMKYYDSANIKVVSQTLYELHDGSSFEAVTIGHHRGRNCNVLVVYDPHSISSEVLKEILS
jgi:predicted P-loop ATPase/GTPase